MRLSSHRREWRRRDYGRRRERRRGYRGWMESELKGGRQGGRKCEREFFKEMKPK